jgi:ribosome biogenesis GTPase
VIATAGRRVLVGDDEGERTCFLSGHRAVVGDRVRWVTARGEGGKIVDVLPRSRALVRSDPGGREQVLAANLGGLAVVASVDQPAYRPGLVDRYLVAAAVADLDALVVLTKVDLPIAPDVVTDVAFRRAHDVEVVPVSTRTGEGVDALRAALEARADAGPWAFVGHSGVGKTSLVAALLPGKDVGPIGDISDYWEAGRHTTTTSTLHRLGERAEIVDSPGIRTFLPGGLEPIVVRDHFPGLPRLGCRYRDCLHRPGEDGCVAEAEVDPELLLRYRRLLDEVLGMATWSQP